MTEIVRTSWTTTTDKLLLNKTKTEVKAMERVVVRSIRCDRVDVSVVQAFAAALEQAGAPGKAKVEAQRSDAGHLIQLTAEWETEIAQPEPPAEDPTTSNCAYCSEPIRYLVNQDRWQHTLGNSGHIASPAPAEPLAQGDQP